MLVPPLLFADLEGLTRHQVRDWPVWLGDAFLHNGLMGLARPPSAARAQCCSRGRLT
ncbi:hypothetical protein [Streptomyces longispororuber]|uniref:hypothetical protein n=1 Tax=Streptomyces longispororuber TaxID=68230 RepID=UPI0036F539B0